MRWCHLQKQCRHIEEHGDYICLNEKSHRQLGLEYTIITYMKKKKTSSSSIFSFLMHIGYTIFPGIFSSAAIFLSAVKAI